MKTLRQIAEGCLHAAKDEFDSTPNNSPAQIITAHAVRSLFYTSAALTNAVLDVADAIREDRKED